MTAYPDVMTTNLGLQQFAQVHESNELTLQLDPFVMTWLEWAARQRGLDLNQVVIEALRNYAADLRADQWARQATLQER